MSAAIIVRNPSEFVPQLTFTPIPVGGTVTNSAVVFEALNFKKVTNSGASFNYAVSQLVPDFNADWTITSDTPAICTVSGNIITLTSIGRGRVRAVGPHGISVAAELDFTSSTTDTYVWTGLTNTTSKSWLLANPTLSLLNASKQSNYYTATYPLPTVPVAPFSRNSNCWASSMDLTGSAIATGLGGSKSAANSGALITKRHWVGVRHWGSGPSNMGPGSSLYFADAAGGIHAREVVSRYLHPTKDIIVCLLNADLPASVKPFKFAGASMFDFPNKRAWGVGWKLNQEKGVSPAIFDHVQSPLAPSNQVTTQSVSWFDFANNTAEELTDTAHLLYPFKNLLYQGRVGDSGGAIGGYYNGETYLVSLFTGPQGGTLYSESIAPEIDAIIASLDAAQGISTGYTVGIIDFSTSLTFQTNQLTLNGNILTFTN